MDKKVYPKSTRITSCELRKIRKHHFILCFKYGLEALSEEQKVYLPIVHSEGEYVRKRLSGLGLHVSFILKKQSYGVRVFKGMLKDVNSYLDNYS